PAEATPRALVKVTGNVRTSLLFTRNAPACGSRTMPPMPAASRGLCHPAPQLARVQERSRTRADGVEIFLHARVHPPGRHDRLHPDISQSRWRKRASVPAAGLSLWTPLT